MRSLCSGLLSCSRRGSRETWRVAGWPSSGQSHLQVGGFGFRMFLCSSCPLCRLGPPQPGLSCLHAPSTLPCPLMVMLVSQTQEAPRGGVHDPSPRRGADAALLAAEPPARGRGLGVGGLSVPSLPRISLPRPPSQPPPLGVGSGWQECPWRVAGICPRRQCPSRNGEVPRGTEVLGAAWTRPSSSCTWGCGSWAAAAGQQERFRLSCLQAPLGREGSRCRQPLPEADPPLPPSCSHS